MVQTYMNMFVTKSKLHKSVRSPVEKYGNPELDTSNILDYKDTHKY